jgi:hypothetical protein
LSSPVTHLDESGARERQLFIMENTLCNSKKDSALPGPIPRVS